MASSNARSEETVRSHGSAEGECRYDVASAATGDTTNGIMRAKHRQTLQSMCARPTPAGIRWADIVAMLEAAGVDVSERSGSRVLLKKGAERMIVHRPHPAPETGRGAIRAIVAFLEAAGVKP